MMENMPQTSLSLSQDPSEIVLISGTPLSPESSRNEEQTSPTSQVEREGSVEATENIQRSVTPVDDIRDESTASDPNVFQIDRQESDQASNGFDVSPANSLPRKKTKYRLSDLNLAKPKKKIVSTFFGTVSVTFTCYDVRKVSDMPLLYARLAQLRISHG
jgi:hypothetical protein